MLCKWLLLEQVEVVPKVATMTSDYNRCRSLQGARNKSRGDETFGDDSLALGDKAVKANASILLDLQYRIYTAFAEEEQGRRMLVNTSDGRFRAQTSERGR